MDLKQMEYLLKIYEKNNLTEAAKDLFISPQALSKLIRLIEEEYGEEIIIRNGNRFTFSQFGLSLVTESKKMLSFYSTFKSNVETYKTSTKENIIIDSPINATYIFGFDQIKKYQSEHPQYNLVMSEYDDYQLENRALNGSADISFIVGDIQSPELFTIKKILESKFGILVTKNHPLANKKIISVKEMAPYPIVTRNENYKIYYKLEKYSHLYNVRFNYTLRTSDTLSVAPMISDDYTVSIAVEAMNRQFHDFIFIPFSEDITWKISCAVKNEKMNDDKILGYLNFFAK